MAGLISVLGDGPTLSTFCFLPLFFSFFFLLLFSFFFFLFSCSLRCFFGVVYRWLLSCWAEARIPLRPPYWLLLPFHLYLV